MLTVEPYKSELLPLWRFKTPADAAQSADAIYHRFEHYKAVADFVGMDMARKFLQMGYTRSRRYARHRSGRKYADDGTTGRGRTELALAPDPDKAQSAQIFYDVLEKVRRDAAYVSHKAQHQLQVKAARVA